MTAPVALCVTRTEFQLSLSGVKNELQQKAESIPPPFCTVGLIIASFSSLSMGGGTGLWCSDQTYPAPGRDKCLGVSRGMALKYPTMDLCFDISSFHCLDFFFLLYLLMYVYLLGNLIMRLSIIHEI